MRVIAIDKQHHCPGCEHWVDSDDEDTIVDDGQLWHQSCLREDRRINEEQDRYERDYDPTPAASPRFWDGINTTENAISKAQADPPGGTKTAQLNQEAQLKTPRNQQPIADWIVLCKVNDNFKPVSKWTNGKPVIGTEKPFMFCDKTRWQAEAALEQTKRVYQGHEYKLMHADLYFQPTIKTARQPPGPGYASTLQEAETLVYNVLEHIRPLLEKNNDPEIKKARKLLQQAWMTLQRAWRQPTPSYAYPTASTNFEIKTAEERLRITSIWDNGGETADRYTIVFNDNSYLAVGDDPDGMYGFSQWGHSAVTPIRGSHRIFEQHLPPDVWEHIQRRMSSETNEQQMEFGVMTKTYGDFQIKTAQSGFSLSQLETEALSALAKLTDAAEAVLDSDARDEMDMVQLSTAAQQGRELCGVNGFQLNER